MAVLCIPFQLEFILFIYFLVWFLWLEFPMLCWLTMLIAGIPVLFLILEGMLSAFATEYALGCSFVIYNLYYFEAYSSYNHFVECFSREQRL